MSVVWIGAHGDRDVFSLPEDVELDVKSERGQSRGGAVCEEPVAVRIRELVGFAGPSWGTPLSEDY